MALLTAQWLGHRSIDATLTLYIQAVAGDIPTDTTADPAYSIYEEETGTAILTGTLAKLDDAGTTGFYSEALTLSAASGFEVDKNYCIRFTATLGLNAQGQMATFRVGPEAADVQRMTAGIITAAVIADGAIDAATFAAGAINAAAIADGAIDAATFAAGAINAAAIADGAIDAATFAAGAINAAAIAADAIGASELAADAVTEIRSVVSGTSDSGTTLTMVDAARTEADTDYWKGAVILFTSGTISGQARLITGFNAATDTVTFAPATTQAVSTQTYEILPQGGVDLQLWRGSVPGALNAGRVDVLVGAMDPNVITATVIAADAIGASEIAAGALDADAFTAAAIGVIADGVWDEDIVAAHGTADTSGEVLSQLTKRAATLTTEVLDGSILGQMLDDGTAVYDRTTDSLQAIRDAIPAAGPSAADNANAVWDELTAEARTAGSYGQLIKDDIDATISSRASAAQATAIQADTDDIQTRLPATLVGGRMRSHVEAMDAGVITAAVIATDAIDADAIAAGAIDAAAVADGTIDAATFAAGAITAAAIATDAIDADALATDAVNEIADATTDKVWDEPTSGHNISGTFGQVLFPIRAGTAQAGGATTITLDAGASAVDDFYNGSLIALTGGTGALQARSITDYVGATKVATISPAWATNPDVTSVFVIVPAATVTGSAATPGDIADAVWDEARAGHVGAGTFGEGVASVQGNVTGSVGSVTGNVGGNVVGNVNGNVVGSVGSVAAGGITAASIATDAIDADAIAAGAIDAAAIADGAIDAATFAAGAINAAAIADGAIDAATFAAGAITAAAIATNAIDADALAPDAVGEIADAVWDEPTAGHNTTGTFGQVLFPIRAGTAQAGAATTITLDVGASAVDDYYNGMLVYWTSGGGDLQARSITDYVGATKVATVSPAWAVNPAAGNAFVILPEPTVTGSTSTPADVADAVWDELRAAHVIAGSFGEGVASVQGNVTGSVGSVAAGGITAASIATDAIDADAIAANAIDASALATDAVNEIAAATTDQVWDEILAGHLAVGSTGEALNNAAAGGSPGAIADAVWDEARAGHVAAGSFGEYVLADVVRISGDVTAADNVEAVFETGGTNTVTMRLAQLSVVNSGGDAIVASSTGGNGHGVNASGNGSGDGIRGTGGATNDSTGIRGASAATNGYGIQGVGSGTRSGIRGIGGATGHGIHGFGGATSGHGVLGQGNANGSGLRGIGGGTAGNSGIVGESGPTGHGIHGFGDGVGNGILGVGGATGHGAQLAGGATSGHGLAAVGQGAGHGILAQGGITSGIGILAKAQANNDRGMSCEANGSGAGFVAAGGTGGGDGLAAVGNGVGAGLRATGGATGDGIRALGGATSGDGLHVEAQTSGDGLQAVGAGGGLPYNPAIGTPAENADAVWDEILGGHLGIGSTGEALAAAAAGGSTPGAIADAVWDEATSGHLISGTFGQAQNAIRAGTAQGGGGTTITLDAGASAIDDFYNFTLVFVTGGTGAGQSRMISDYVGATKVATVNATWGTNPDGTSVFVILPFGSIPGVVAPSAADNANAVWDELTAEGRALGSYGQLLKDDIDATISSRASAAALAVAQADLDNIQTRLPAGLNGGRMSSHVEAMDAAVVNQIVDQTWDEILAGHLNVGSTGEALNDAAAGGGGGGASAAAVADAVWEEQKADHEGATIFGNVGQDLDDLEFTGNEG